MNRLALTRHQRHALFALGDQHGVAIGKLHDLLRCLRDACFAINAAPRRLVEFLAVGLEQRRAAIDGKIRAFGVDDHGLAELARRVDHVADHARRQHALGVVGEQHHADIRQTRQHRIDQLLLDLGGGGRRQFPISPQHVSGEMFGNEAHLAGGRPAGIANQHAFDSAFPLECRLEPRARLVLADQANEDAACAERSDVARHVAGAADIGFAALNGNHRRGRLGRDPRYFAIDELVEHEIADAQHGLAGDGIRQGVKIEHGFS